MGGGGLKDIETYISRWKHIIAQYIKTRPILDLLLEAAQRPGAQVKSMWLEQGGLKIAGSREEDEEVWVCGGGGGLEESDDKETDRWGGRDNVAHVNQ